MGTGNTYDEITMGEPNTPADELRFRQDAIEYFVRVGDITLEQSDMVKVESSAGGRLLSATVKE